MADGETAAFSCSPYKHTSFIVNYLNKEKKYEMKVLDQSYNFVEKWDFAPQQQQVFNYIQMEEYEVLMKSGSKVIVLKDKKQVYESRWKNQYISVGDGNVGVSHRRILFVSMEYNLVQLMLGSSGVEEKLLDPFGTKCLSLEGDRIVLMRERGFIKTRDGGRHLQHIEESCSRWNVMVKIERYIVASGTFYKARRKFKVSHAKLSRTFSYCCKQRKT